MNLSRIIADGFWEIGSTKLRNFRPDIVCLNPVFYNPNTVFLPVPKFLLPLQNTLMLLLLHNHFFSG